MLISRRSALIVGAVGWLPILGNIVGAQPTWAAQEIDVNGILHDPEAPESGNPKGDLTIVAFFDYNCPFCKKAEPELQKVVKEDGKIRLVYKDWPILTEASVYGAQIALGAKYQGKYQAAHDTLMGIPGSKVDKAGMTKAVQAAGVDMERLEADIHANADSISGLLHRTHAQAESMGLMGTPVYLIGQFKVAAALDAVKFREVVSQARERQAGR
jgi:protein-disulfide isomerase